MTPDRYYFFFPRSIYATQSIPGISGAAADRARYTRPHTGHFPRWTRVYIRVQVRTQTHDAVCLATPLLRPVLWTIDVGQEFVIPRPSHSCSFS